MIVPRITTLNTILNTAKNLEKIYLQPQHQDMDPIYLDETNLKDILIKSVSSSKKLNYFEIAYFANRFFSICNGIEVGLMNVSHIVLEKLTLKV